MTRMRCLGVAAAAVGLVLIALCVGAWWYLFGPNPIAAAELVPGDTVAFATIPNGLSIATGYETSQLKTLVDSPNSQPLADAAASMLGQKTLDLLKTFAPNLSGQSFIALTHFDPAHPEQMGLIAAMKPKAGMGNFDAFVEKLKAAWPDAVKQGTTGTGNVAGVDYQWIKGPAAAEKICVAQVSGWIVTAGGEDALQDWIERFNKKATTPSLAQNPDYQQSLKRLGADPMTLLYINFHAFTDILQKQMATTNPTGADYLAKKMAATGGVTVATRFENGEIVDRFSLLMPRQAQLDAGMAVTPCPFETLGFTAPETRFYWGSSINFQQYWKNLQEQAAMTPPASPVAASIVNFVQSWAQGAGIDVQRNIIDPLGSEFSAQVEWSDDDTWPSAGVFVKVDKPDDFKPTLAAIVSTVRAAYVNSAVVNELTASGHTFAVLKFIQNSVLVPTITEDGPYFGIFTSANQAVHSFERNAIITLPNNADFIRQVGDKRNGASQLFFLDTPPLLDRAYKMATPYVSVASMFNAQLAGMLKGHALPGDVSWLAPVGTWSLVVNTDDAGLQGYSTSGIGNQGILLAAAAGGGAAFLQQMGMLPKTSPFGAPPLPVAPAIVPAMPVANPPMVSPVTPPTITPPATDPVSTTPAPVLPVVPANDTNAPASAFTAAPPTSDVSTNAAPGLTPPATAVPITNSNATPATPATTPPQ